MTKYLVRIILEQVEVDDNDEIVHYEGEIYGDDIMMYKNRAEAQKSVDRFVDEVNEYIQQVKE